MVSLYPGGMPASILYDVSNEILVAARDSLKGVPGCLDPSTGTGSCGSLSSFVAFCGAGEDDTCCHKLTVSPRGLRPIYDGNSGGVFNLDKPCMLAGTILDLTVRYGRCAPTMNDQGDIPAWQMDQSARDLMTDLWLVYTGLLAKLGEGVAAAGGCASGKLGNYSCFGPTGGCAGFTIDVSLQVECVCGPSLPWCDTTQTV